jgi:hypothetical protein
MVLISRTSDLVRPSGPLTGRPILSRWDGQRSAQKPKNAKKTRFYNMDKIFFPSYSDCICFYFDMLSHIFRRKTTLRLNGSVFVIPPARKSVIRQTPCRGQTTVTTSTNPRRDDQRAEPPCASTRLRTATKSTPRSEPSSREFCGLLFCALSNIFS